MNVIICSQQDSTTSLGRYVTIFATCGKHSATVTIGPVRVSVVVQNAAHRAWRRGGRQFDSVELAIAGYKLPEIRAIIEAAALAAKGKA